jgi:hypothetical protein
MSHDNSRDRIVRNVVAAIATAGGVIGALVVTSAQEGKDVTPDTHAAIYAASEVLRGMGRSEADAKRETRKRTGSDKAHDGALVDDIVHAGYGHRDRHPSTIRSVALVMSVPVAAGAAFDAAWPVVYCEPVAPVKQGDDSVLYDECLAAQAGSRSAALCVGVKVAGHVVRIQATPDLADRAQGLAAAGVTLGEPPVEWGPCPEVAP